jgi:lysophospholipase L1-like esterase
VRRGIAVALVASLTVVVVAIAVFAARNRNTREAADLDPNPRADARIVALGDSYISGEGAQRFFPGTNRFAVNECRRAATAYPWLVASRLRFGLTFAACSGAKLADIFVASQFPNSPADVLGGRPQIEVLRSADADIVLVSVGGNDVGFSEIGRTCAFHNCLPNKDRWLRSIEDIQPELVTAYEELRATAGGAPVFVMTYPNPLGQRDCLPGFSSAEWTFLRDEFIPKLNDSIVLATRLAGVNLIDLRNAFDGYRVCEVDPEAGALNIIGLGPVEGMRLNLLKLNHNTFHPNRRGHSIMAAVVAEAITRTRTNPEPEVIGGGPSTPPAETPATGAFRFPTGTDCEGERLDYVVEAQIAARGDIQFEIVGAAPESVACFLTANGSWASARVDEDGFGVVTATVTDRRTGAVLYLDSAGHWTRIDLVPAE